jgi:hypothetical protein
MLPSGGMFTTSRLDFATATRMRATRNRRSGEATIPPGIHGRRRLDDDCEENAVRGCGHVAVAEGREVGTSAAQGAATGPSGGPRKEQRECRPAKGVVLFQHPDEEGGSDVCRPVEDRSPDRCSSLPGSDRGDHHRSDIRREPSRRNLWVDRLGKRAKPLEPTVERCGVVGPGADDQNHVSPPSQAPCRGQRHVHQAQKRELQQHRHSVEVGEYSPPRCGSRHLQPQKRQRRDGKGPLSWASSPPPLFLDHAAAAAWARRCSRASVGVR